MLVYARMFPVTLECKNCCAAEISPLNILFFSLKKNENACHESLSNLINWGKLYRGVAIPVTWRLVHGIF